MIHITEEKLRAAIQICLGGDSIYTEKREANLVHDIKALSIADVIQRSELVCMCKGTTQVNRINDRYICCTCNRPLM